MTTRKVKSNMGWVDSDGIIWVSNLILITYYLTSCFGLHGGPSGSAMAFAYGWVFGQSLTLFSRRLLLAVKWDRKGWETFKGQRAFESLTATLSITPWNLLKSSQQPSTTLNIWPNCTGGYESIIFLLLQKIKNKKLHIGQSRAYNLQRGLKFQLE